MEITLSQQTLSAMMHDAAELAVNAAMSKVGLMKPYLTKQEAYKMFGRRLVDRAIQEGLVSPFKDSTASAKWRIDRLEIESVFKANNRPSYRAVKQR